MQTIAGQLTITPVKPTPPAAAAEPVRLVIWDLDETFWKGTLTEGGVELVEANHAIVVELARRGIVSSICSKNDMAAVRPLLEQAGLWEYFVFPSIDWQPKGPRVAALVEQAQLRPASVLFIDDNPLNLREAQHYTPALQVADHRFIPHLLADRRCRGKDDHALSRLAQYRVLEQRQADRPPPGADTTEFLRASRIRVTLEHDLVAHADRAVELINRTNQLNFTKQRLPDDPERARAAFLSEVQAYNIKGALVRVQDNYGDYGFVGLFVMRARALVYFCFSCRVLHMGVEDWVFDWLGRPHLRVVGEVLTDLFRERGPVDWITLDTGAPTAASVRPKLPSIRARGGCDVDPISHYLRPFTTDFRCEFSVNRENELRVRLDHSWLLRLAQRRPAQRAVDAMRRLGYLPQDCRTTLFDDVPDGTVFLLSNWADPWFCLYQHREFGFVVPCPFPELGHVDLTATSDADLAGRIDDKALPAVRFLRQSFTALGQPGLQQIAASLHKVFATLPPRSRCFVLLAVERRAPTDGGGAVEAKNVLLNRAIRQAAARFRSVTLVDVGRFIADERQIQATNHFDRRVYHAVASAMLEALERPPSAELPEAPTPAG